MKKISIIIGLARPSFGAYQHDSALHLLLPTLQSLDAQVFRDFELVVSDALYKKRNIASEIRNLGNWSFDYSVTHPESYWLDNGFWALQNSFNMGYAASCGKFLFFAGDCCYFEPDTFQKMSDLMDSGYSPSCLCAYRYGDRLIRASGPTRYNLVSQAKKDGEWNDQFIRDSRWRMVEGNNGFVGPSGFGWEQLYGYCSVKREDFEYVNGYDENFDGDKALGDVELGSRLFMAKRWSPCLDANVVAYESKHNGLDVVTFANSRNVKAIRANYDLLYLMKNRGIWRANSTEYSEKDCEDVCLARITGIDSDQYAITSEDKRASYQQHWMKNQAVFEITKLKPVIM